MQRYNFLFHDYFYPKKFLPVIFYNIFLDKAIFKFVFDVQKIY